MLHSWNLKWNNDKSDGNREDIISRHCVHCDVEQRVIYSKGRTWARVINFDKYGKEVQHLVACVPKEDKPEKKERNVRGPNIRTKRREGAAVEGELTPLMATALPGAKVITVPKEMMQETDSTGLSLLSQLNDKPVLNGKHMNGEELTETLDRITPALNSQPLPQMDVTVKMVVMTEHQFRHLVQEMIPDMIRDVIREELGKVFKL
jgi:hypothetical protein